MLNIHHGHPLALLFIILCELIKIVEQQNAHHTISRKFVPAAQRAKEMRSRFNQFRTITMPGGHQQFVLVPWGLFLRHRHIFARPLISFNRAPHSSSGISKPKNITTPSWATTNLTELSEIGPRPQAKSGPILKPRVTNVGSVTRTSSNPIKPITVPKAAVPPHRTMPTKRPPLREVSSSVEDNFAPMARKKGEELLKKQQKELKEMREKVEKERHRLEKERQRILEERKHHEKETKKKLLEKQHSKEHHQHLANFARERTFSLGTTSSPGTITRRPFPSPAPLMPPKEVHPASTESPPEEAAPPAQMPPSDEVIDELNNAVNFMDVANKLRLRERFSAKSKRMHHT